MLMAGGPSFVFMVGYGFVTLILVALFLKETCRRNARMLGPCHHGRQFSDRRAQPRLPQLRRLYLLHDGRVDVFPDQLLQCLHSFPKANPAGICLMPLAAS